jgi:hypothetical protein
MTLVTHFFVSWVIAAKTTNNPRDCRLVTLAGILPDADGLGLIVDAASRALGYRGTLFYEHYHHFLLHGIYGGIAIAALMTCFARQRWRVALLALLVFHVHLLCDLVGSRGPDPVDLWPIFYLGPISKNVMWIWKGQWQLDAWPNRILSVVMFIWSLKIAVQLGHSFIGVFNRRLDEIFVGVLRKWDNGWKARHNKQVKTG